MKYINRRIACRVVALCVAVVGAVGGMKSQGGWNLFLWLGFIFSFLAFGEFESNDLTQKLTLKTMTSVKIEITWLGKLFEMCSLFAYGAYIVSQVILK